MIKKIAAAIADSYAKKGSLFSLEGFFDQQMKKAESNILKKIGQEREARRHRILNEAKDGDFNDLNEENEDDEIIKKVREKIVLRKLFVTTRFWYIQVTQGISR